MAYPKCAHVVVFSAYVECVLSSFFCVITAPSTIYRHSSHFRGPVSYSLADLSLHKETRRRLSGRRQKLSRSRLGFVGLAERKYLTDTPRVPLLFATMKIPLVIFFHLLLLLEGGIFNHVGIDQPRRTKIELAPTSDGRFFH